MNQTRRVRRTKPPKSKPKSDQPKIPLAPLEEPITQRSLELTQTSPLKLSYCTTTYNRFWQLKQVVKQNITIINQHQPAEWIIVDFGGRDSQEIADWLEKNCPKSLAKGTLKYYRRKSDLPEFIWNVSQAKNLAHRLAEGDILVNLDGDNFLQKQDPSILRQLFTQNPKALIHQTWNNFLIQYNLRAIGRGRQVAYKEYQPNFSGSNGRISLARQHFLDLGGYDEEMLFMGFQDTDLITRGVLAKLDYQARKPIEADNQIQSRITCSTLASVGNKRVLRLAGRRGSQRSIRPNQNPNQAYSSRNRDQPDPYAPSHLSPIPQNPYLRRSNSLIGTRSLLRPPTPLKAENQDSIGNQRSKPYSNNKVKSWKEAEKHNRALSYRKIRQGQLKVNREGFQISLTDFVRSLIPIEEPKEPEEPKELEIPEELKILDVSEEGKL